MNAPPEPLEPAALEGPAEQPAVFMPGSGVLATGGEFTPRALLDACQAIERAAGRMRGERWASRIIDLDIVRFGDRAVAEPGLTLPHPELPHRAFWQRELAEVLAHDG